MNENQKLFAHFLGYSRKLCNLAILPSVISVACSTFVLELYLAFLPSCAKLNVLSVDIKSWDIQNLLIVYQTFELSLKIKIVIKELNFNLMFLTVYHWYVIIFITLFLKSQIYTMYICDF
jgi:hypothetical protein